MTPTTVGQGGHLFVDAYIKCHIVQLGGPFLVVPNPDGIGNDDPDSVK